MFLEGIGANIVVQQLQALLPQQESKHLEQYIVLFYTYISKDTVLKQLISSLSQSLELRVAQIAQPSYNYIESQRKTLECYQILSYTLTQARVRKGIFCLKCRELVGFQVYPNTYYFIVITHFVVLNVQIGLGLRTPNTSQVSEYSLLGLKASIELLLQRITNKYKYKGIYYFLGSISQLNLDTSIEYYKNRANSLNNYQKITTIGTESKQNNISSTVPVLIVQRSVKQVATY